MFNCALFKYKFTITQSFLLLFFLSFLSVFSLIRENVSYIDDYFRSLYGLGDWLNYSRYTSEYFSKLVHSSSFLADISPIPQIIAISELACSGIMLMYIFTNSNKYSFFQILSVFPICVNPYMYQCLAYKFDAPYMALSVLSAILPFLFIRNSIAFFLIVIVCTVIILTSYQVSIGIFLVVFIFKLLIQYLNNVSYKILFKQILHFCFSFLVGTVCFKLFLFSENGHATQTISKTDFLERFFFNILEYYKVIVSDSLDVAFLSFGVMSFLFVLLNCLNYSKKVIFAALFSILSIVIGLVSLFLLYSFLDTPPHEARQLYGIATLVSIIFLFTLLKKEYFISRICIFCCCWSFIVFGAAFGNALVAQKEYEEYRMILVINDLKNIVSGNNEYKIHIKGNVGKSPLIFRLENKYPLIKRMIVAMFFDSKFYFGCLRFFGNYGLKNIINDPNIIIDKTRNFKEIDTMFHIILIQSDKIEVVLK
ncbi:MAG: hypothetical protein DBY31_01250 [Succinivibrio sp.]|nr:MAG: hypothetical protein DBY31_01250 [Succinivibrio sp.]